MAQPHDCVVKTHIMNALADLLSSKVKAEVFRLLFGVRDDRLHLRELARQSGLAVGTVRQELSRLKRLGVVEAEVDGNRTCYRANEMHPLFPGINSLVRQTVGVVDVLRDSLRNAPVCVAFIYGSAAGRPEQLEREFDVMVIGSIAKRQLERRLADGACTAGRRINFYLRNVEQFRRQKREHERALSTVLAAPRLFITGDERSLGEL